MKNKSIGILFIGYLTLIIMCVGGWVLNVIKFVKTDFESPYKEEVVRAVGIVIPPVGFISGYLTFK